MYIMSGVKTAISVNEYLFTQVNNLAREMHISRSRLFSLAVEEFIKKNANKKMYDQINATYKDDVSEEEKNVLNSMKTKQRRTLERETW